MSEGLRQCVAPRLLKVGDRVRIVAPSGPVDRERFMSGVARLESLGLQPVYDDGVFAAEAYLAGSDARRWAELAAALADDSIHAIWIARGGYGASRLLGAFAPETVAEHPHWLIGFSDATPLHCLWQRAGLQSLHAANMTGLDQWSDAAVASLQGWLFDGICAPLQGRSMQGGSVVSGPLVGGNLTVLAALTGTGFMPALKGAIVFLEDVAERPYRLDRCLTQLSQAGVFEGVGGFVIGQLTHCVDRAERDYGCDALTAVHSVLERIGAPILAGVNVGHERSSMPLPLGATATLDMAAEELRFGKD